MLLRQLGWLCLPIVLVACGGDDRPAATLRSPAAEAMLVGARSIDVLGDPVNGITLTSFNAQDRGAAG